MLLFLHGQNFDQTVPNSESRYACDYCLATYPLASWILFNMVNGRYCDLFDETMFWSLPKSRKRRLAIRIGVSNPSSATALHMEFFSKYHQCCPAARIELYSQISQMAQTHTCWSFYTAYYANHQKSGDLFPNAVNGATQMIHWKFLDVFTWRNYHPDRLRYRWSFILCFPYMLWNINSEVQS